MPDEPLQMLDPKALAERLSMPVSSIYRLVRETDIPRYRFGRLIRFRVEQVLEWIKTTQEGDHSADPDGEDQAGGRR